MRKITTAILSICWLSVHADRFEWNTYYFEDDQDNSVYTTSFGFLKTLWESTRLVFDAELDQVTVAPIVDGTSGATRPSIQKTEKLEKNRGQFIMGLQQDVGLNHELSLQGYLSRESDYQSQAISGNYTSRWAKQNFIVKVSGQYNFDRVGKIAEDYSYTEKLKETYGLGLSLSQNLGRSVVYSFKGDYSKLEGYLGDPYRQVTLDNGSLTDETPPERRERFGFGNFLKLGMPFAEASLEMNYRYYFDLWGEEREWGIESNTLGFKLAKQMGSYVIFDLNYRYYSQSKAFFFKESYAQSERYKTADYKLNSFESQNFGLGLFYLLGGITEVEGWDWLETTSLRINYFHYTNTLDFSGNIVEIGWVTEF